MIEIVMGDVILCPNLIAKSNAYILANLCSITQYNSTVCVVVLDIVGIMYDNI